MVMAAQFMLNSCSRLYQVLPSHVFVSVLFLRVTYSEVALGEWMVGLGRLRGLNMVARDDGSSYQAKTTSPVGMSAGTVKSKVWPSAVSPPLRCGQLPWYEVATWKVLPASTEKPTWQEPPQWLPMPVKLLRSIVSRVFERC